MTLRTLGRLSGCWRRKNSINPSRTSQRRSKALPGSVLLTSARTSTAVCFVSESNLFDLSEFAFHHNDVVDKQRLGQCDLNTGEYVAEGLLRSETNHHPSNSGGR